MGAGYLSVNPVPTCGLRPHQLFHRRQYPPPHRPIVQVASFEHGVHPHGGLDWRLGAVLIDQQAGGAPDVEV